MNGSCIEALLGQLPQLRATSAGNGDLPSVSAEGLQLWSEEDPGGDVDRTDDENPYPRCRASRRASHPLAVTLREPGDGLGQSVVDSVCRAIAENGDSPANVGL